jgi:hypothetical protein
MTVSDRIHFASMRYGDQLLEQEHTAMPLDNTRTHQQLHSNKQHGKAMTALHRLPPSEPTIDHPCGYPMVTTEYLLLSPTPPVVVTTSSPTEVPTKLQHQRHNHPTRWACAFWLHLLATVTWVGALRHFIPVLPAMAFAS